MGRVGRNIKSVLYLMGLNLMSSWGVDFFLFLAERSEANSRASRACRVDLFEPRRDIVGMEQKSVEAVTFQMLALIQALIFSP